MAYLDSVTEEQVKTILLAWYGEYNVRNINVNDKVLILVAAALVEAQKCSASMKWVPVGSNPIAAGGALVTASIGYAKTIVSNVISMQTYSLPCVIFTSNGFKDEILANGMY